METLQFGYIIFLILMMWMVILWLDWCNRQAYTCPSLIFRLFQRSLRIFSWLSNGLSNKRACQRLPQHRGPRPVRRHMVTRPGLPYTRYMRKVCPTPMAWMENLSKKIRHISNH
jgi:hypothetical protein